MSKIILTSLHEIPSALIDAISNQYPCISTTDLSAEELYQHQKQGYELSRGSEGLFGFDGGIKCCCSKADVDLS